jgi:ribosomal protein L7/L12
LWGEIEEDGRAHAMPNCRYCNHDNPPTAERCANCGAWLRQSASPQAAGTPPPQPPPAWTDDLEAAVIPLLAAGRKIEAVKVYRERTGAGLREAKEAVEALAAQRGLAAQGAGCAGATLVVLVAGAVAWLARGLA